MFLLSAIFNCFMLKSSSSSRVFDEEKQVSEMKLASSDHKKAKAKSKPSRAPIVVSYFPVNSMLSRL
ncbi:hypothetical protein ACOSP7_019042 [Xanthoceras sorbifolium]